MSEITQIKLKEGPFDGGCIALNKTTSSAFWVQGEPLPSEIWVASCPECGFHFAPVELVPDPEPDLEVELYLFEKLTEPRATYIWANARLTPDAFEEAGAAEPIPDRELVPAGPIEKFEDESILPPESSKPPASRGLAAYLEVVPGWRPTTLSG